jgi:hypothetical protein
MLNVRRWLVDVETVWECTQKVTSLLGTSWLHIHLAINGELKKRGVPCDQRRMETYDDVGISQDPPCAVGRDRPIGAEGDGARRHGAPIDNRVTRLRLALYGRCNSGTRLNSIEITLSDAAFTRSLLAIWFYQKSSMRGCNLGMPADFCSSDR